ARGVPRARGLNCGECPPSVSENEPLLTGGASESERQTYPAGRLVLHGVDVAGLESVRGHVHRLLRWVMPTNWGSAPTGAGDLFGNVSWIGNPAYVPCWVFFLE